jgi:hypothetical protein
MQAFEICLRERNCHVSNSHLVKCSTFYCRSFFAPNLLNSWPKGFQKLFWAEASPGVRRLTF